MVSGAGHDAMIASIVPAGMLFVPSREAWLIRRRSLPSPVTWPGRSPCCSKQ